MEDATRDARIHLPAAPEFTPGRFGSETARQPSPMVYLDEPSRSKKHT